jgi:putative tryptophan/tyrosine transport system substrate-binding protein
MDRRAFLTLCGGALTGGAKSALAQSPTKVYRAALLSTSGAVTDDSPNGKSLVAGLLRRGYAQGSNLVFDRRGADARMERLPRLLDELLENQPDVLVTFGYPAALIAKQRNTSRLANQQSLVPVVAFATGDPVATGLVDSLAQPGGTITGISDVSAELTPKRMELLKQVAPSLKRVAMLWNAGDLGMTMRYRASETGAKALGVSVLPLGVREPDDFDQAFAAMNRDKADGILMVADSLTLLNRKRVFEFAAAHRLPAIFEYDWVVREGGLMSYAPDLDESFDRIAALVDRVLKGASPADLPFEQPTRFKFALNLKTAKALGLEVPTVMLAVADEVIE